MKPKLIIIGCMLLLFTLFIRPNEIWSIILIAVSLMFIVIGSKSKDVI
jgi:hypothetical protein